MGPSVLSNASKTIFTMLRSLKLFLYMNFIHTPYRLLVDMIGNFLADIMEHPRVQQAAAETMAKGMNLHMEDPDLPRRAAKIYIQLQEDADMSRQLGEQFPKVAASFIAGAASSLKRQASFSKLKKLQQQQQQQNSQRSRPQSPSVESTRTASTCTDMDTQSPIANENDAPSIDETPKEQSSCERSANKEDALIKLSFPWNFGVPSPNPNQQSQPHPRRQSEPNPERPKIIAKKEFPFLSRMKTVSNPST